MIRPTLVVPVTLLVAGCAADQMTPARDANMAHAHMGHVLTSWQDTPDQAGLLPTAVAEADVAVQHAGFAASRPDDLDWMKLHVVHVVHAVDPAAEPAGPGLGYGVEQAAAGVAKHVGFAAESEGASDNVKLHAEHVATSAENVVQWSERIVDLGAAVEAATSAQAAAPIVAEIETLTIAVRNGTDANGDGQVTWQAGEGGLAQAEQHMEFMRQGEGLS
ncbi:MAG TPA: hypothetical protein VLE23_08815 [Geminicoccaceae bacterium]|nr:hypothetical protein [Geminicoccaceae bacterium]